MSNVSQEVTAAGRGKQIACLGKDGDKVATGKKAKKSSMPMGGGNINRVSTHMLLCGLTPRFPLPGSTATLKLTHEDCDHDLVGMLPTPAARACRVCTMLPRRVRRPTTKVGFW